MTRDLDSYLAGLFDGEGCVQVYVRISTDKRRGRVLKGLAFEIRVRINMTDRAPLDLFRQRFGGAVRVARPAVGARRQVYTWEISQRAAREPLRVFAEFCVTKKEQAKIALDAIALLCPHALGRDGLPREAWEARRALSDKVRMLKSVPVNS